jgi:cell division protein FtsL
MRPDRNPYGQKEYRGQTAVQDFAPSQREHRLSEQARKNRAKAMQINWGFVIFLTVVMAAVMFSCVNYIRLHSVYITQMRDVNKLERDLADLKEENDAYRSEVISGLDLERVKKVALTRLGMHKPEDSQIVQYTTTEGSGFVRQYQDLPE